MPVSGLDPDPLTWCLSLGAMQVLILSVLACIRMYGRYRRLRPLTREVLARDPYCAWDPSSSACVNILDRPETQK